MSPRRAEDGFRSSLKSYSMLDIRKLMKKVKAQRSEEGLPSRKISPISLWILDDILNRYFENESQDYILDKVNIKRSETII